MHSKLKVCIKLPWSPEEEKLCSIRKGQEKLYRKFEIRSFERFKTMDKSQEKGCFRKKKFSSMRSLTSELFFNMNICQLLTYKTGLTMPFLT